MTTDINSQTSSYRHTLDRFDSPRAAAKYPARYGSSFRARREQRCITGLLRSLKASNHLKPGATVLDLPCGTGRLTPLLVNEGFHVRGADSSPHMVELARTNFQQLETNAATSRRTARFDCADVMQTGYADKQFDAVLCNRLFHHFHESETRIAALRELRRICAGPVIISFFNRFALDALRRRIKHVLRGTTRTGRIPIPARTFYRDIEGAGLEVPTAKAVLWGLSPHWFVVARDRENSPAAST